MKELPDFWRDERCEYCNGAIISKRVRLHKRVKRRDVFVERVPAGVCKECGTRYYSANVLKTLAEITRGRRRARIEVKVPVYSL
jgi:YgiT-type zinc finger domain-containing protein